MTRALQATALVAVAGLFALLVWRLAHQSHPAKVGGPVPNFTLKRLEGSGTISLASLRGKPAVINFFASWCGPCKAEAKILESASQQYRGRISFIGIDYHDVTSDGRRFLQAHGITFPTVQDGALYSNNGVDTSNTQTGPDWVKTQYSGGYQCTELAHRYLLPPAWTRRGAVFRPPRATASRAEQTPTGGRRRRSRRGTRPGPSRRHRCAAR